MKKRIYGKGYKTPPKKLVVLISGTGSNMTAILNACKNKRINGEIKAVISSNADAKGLLTAKSQGIDTHVFSKKDYGDSRDEKMLEVIKGYEPDYIILAGYLGIITEPLLKAYPLRIINIHPALLPKYGGKDYYGLNVHRAVIKAGEKRTGVTVHYVDAGTDTGPILSQKKVKVKPSDTPEILQKRVLKSEHDLFVRTIRALCNGKTRQRKINKYYGRTKNEKESVT